MLIKVFICLERQKTCKILLTNKFCFFKNEISCYHCLRFLRLSVSLVRREGSLLHVTEKSAVVTLGGGGGGSRTPTFPQAQIQGYSRSLLDDSTVGPLTLSTHDSASCRT